VASEAGTERRLSQIMFRVSDTASFGRSDTGRDYCLDDHCVKPSATDIGRISFYQLTIVTYIHIYCKKKSPKVCCKFIAKFSVSGGRKSPLDPYRGSAPGPVADPRGHMPQSPKFAASIVRPNSQIKNAFCLRGVSFPGPPTKRHVGFGFRT